jgi:TldD protein
MSDHEVVHPDTLSSFAHEAGDLALQSSEEDGLAYFARFGVDESLFRQAFTCALSRGGDWADLFFEHSISEHIMLQDAAVNSAYTGVSLGVGVRVICGDQTGYAYTEDLSVEAVKQAAYSAALIATNVGMNTFEQEQGFAVSKHKTRYAIEKDWMSVSLDQKIPLLQQLNAEAFAADERMQKVQINMGHSVGAILIVESNGAIHFDRQPMTRMGMSCTAQKDEQRESNSYNLAARQGFEFVTPERLQTLRQESVDRTLFLFDAKPAPAGSMPIVLGAGASGILLHEAIGHGMEADFNRKGISVYSDLLNQRIAPKGVNIIDDGTRIHDRGAINVDDEGVESQETVLVEDGILRTYMHDRMSAKHYQVAPTGNGRRQSFRHAPVPRMRSTYMTAGDYDPQEIIASVDRGIYAETFTNGQVMIGAGDFTFYIKTGYLIENGKLTQPIKDTNIIGNGPEVLKRTDMIGSDFTYDEGGWVCGKDGQSVPVSLGMPTVRVSEITIGGVNS